MQHLLYSDPVHGKFKALQKEQTRQYLCCPGSSTLVSVTGVKKSQGGGGQGAGSTSVKVLLKRDLKEMQE
jgi:hypothetical protein